MPEAPPETAQDDATIPDAARLLRRIPKNSVYTNRDGTTRPFAGAFKPRRGEPVSVYIEPLLVDRGLTFGAALDGQEDRFWLVAVTAGFIRQLELGILREPDPDDGPRGEAHGVIVGKLNEHARDEMAAKCERLVWPTM